MEPGARDPDTLCMVRQQLARPDLFAVSAGHPERYPFLLESSTEAAAQSRFDVLLAFPGEAIELDTADRDAFDSSAALDDAFARERDNAVGTTMRNLLLHLEGRWATPGIDRAEPPARRERV